jgi:hypothetical protein
MIAMREVTNWLPAYNHTYLFDGSKAVAYIKGGTTEPIYFNKPLNIDQRGRKFVVVSDNPFKQIKTESRMWSVKSKGKVYIVTLSGKDMTCTCTGFKYRHYCKHVSEVEKRI